MTRSTTTKDPAHTWTRDVPTVAWAVVCLVVLSIPLMFLGLGRYSAVNGDEVNYQMMALTMVRTGDWFTLMNGDHPRVYDTYMNAPLQYWWRAMLISLFGKSAWTMRIHSALFGLAAVLMTYRLTLYIAGRRAAFIAGLVLLTTFQFVFLHSARTGETETPLVFLFVAAAYLFIRVVEVSRRGWLWHHVCLVCIFNLKIPVVLIPALAELACFGLSARARKRLASWIWTGVAVLPIGLSWHLYQAATHFEEFRHTFFEMRSHASQSLRMGQERGGIANLERYGPIVLFGAFPYALAYPLAIVDLLRQRVSGRRAAVDRDGVASGGADGGTPPHLDHAALRNERIQVLLVYGAAIAIFFVVIAKRGPWYPMPLYPFLAALLGIWLADLSRSRVGDVALAAVAVVGSLVFALEIPIASYNPFSQPALVIPMQTSWRELAGLSPWLVVPVLAGLLFAVMRWLRARLGERFSIALALGLTLVLFGYAGVRCIAALRFVDYQSPIGALHAKVEEQRAAGRALAFPIVAPDAHNWIVRYYFWDDFEIRPGPRHPKTGRPFKAKAGYLLYERKQVARDGKFVPPPRALTREDRIRLGIE